MMADGTDRVMVDGTGWYDMYARLPADVTCEYCVIQWTYTGGILHIDYLHQCVYKNIMIDGVFINTGNNNNPCGNGTDAYGCGNQETFRNCADVAIV